MNGIVSNERAVDDLNPGGIRSAGPIWNRTGSVDAMLHRLGATSEGFAYGSTALAAAVSEHRSATIAAHVARWADDVARLACWRCRHNDRGIDLVPFDSVSTVHRRFDGLEASAASLVGDGGPGDVLIVCDPWGEHDLLYWSLRFAAQRRMTTVAITTDQPNFLTVLADHSVRVPAAPAVRQELVVSALRFLVQTAGGALEANRRRATRPLRPVLIT